ncbi:sugar phosphate isomerase/epimerase family protein [Halomicrococcus sp. NG-SE-24]|uniref:sugar phosphate isomerase/epimerase family protein n=1 Tax=Halomicrococcus sp. NG-SE-24 TaxID=3436928 RepID=UPI003D99EBBB
MKLGTTLGPNRHLVEEETATFDFVEPALNPRDCPVEEFDAAGFRAKLDDADLDCTVHLPHFPDLATTVPEIDAAMREYQERALAKAETLDAEVGVVHASAGVHDDRHREAFVEQASWLADACRDRGLELVVENLGYTSEGFPLAEVAELAREAGASVCFDVGHAYLEGGQAAVESFLTDHGDLVRHLHVHDARERGDDHVPVGTGSVDFAPVMAWAADRDVTVAVELLVDDYAFQRDSVRRLRDLALT